MLETPHKIAFRKLIFDLHMWSGVALSLYLIVICLTGSALVFREELEVAVAGDPKIAIKGDRLDFEPLLKSVASAYPDYRVTGIINTIETDRPIRFYAKNDKAQYIAVMVDPYSGQLLGQAYENGILKFLQELHFNLLLDRNGRIANAVGGAFLCLISVSGLVLWWKGLRTWKRGLTVNIRGSSRRINWDLHNAVGFWLSPLLLTWGLSGVYFGFRPEFEKAINTAFPVTAQVQKQALKEQENSDDAADVSFDDMIDTAKRAAPGHWIARIAAPASKKQALQVWLTDVNSYRKDENTEVDINQNSGEIIAISTPEQRRSGDLILIWLTRLHFGNFGGAAIKIVWMILGLTPAFLAVTGIIMWWHRSLRKQFKRGVDNS